MLYVNWPDFENRQERSEVETEKSQDSARIWTQNLLNSSQTLLVTGLLGPDGNGVYDTGTLRN